MKTEIVKRIFASAVLLSLTFVVVAQAKVKTQEADRTQVDQDLQNAKVVSVEAHPEGRPFDYVNDSSSLNYLYDDYPYYDITLQVGGKNYVVRYDSMGGYYPSAWKTGSEVKVRMDHGKMSILRYDGVLVDTPIMQS